MDNKKFDQLIDLIINENEEKARELFHDIVVAKSREIYESIMDDEMMEENPMDGSQVGDMMDEISAEEEGMSDEDADADMDTEIDIGDDENSFDLDNSEEESEAAEHEEVEDAVIRIEDKLDQLMAEFEEIMGGGAGEDEIETGEDDIETGEDDMEAGEEDEEEVMEAVQLQKVTVTHGDDGVQTKSTVRANSGQSGMASKPVKFSGNTEQAPKGPKGPSNAYSKGEKDVPGAGKFKNAPGQKGQKLDTAPKPTTSQASGVNNKSPIK